MRGGQEGREEGDGTCLVGGWGGAVADVLESVRREERERGMREEEAYGTCIRGEEEAVGQLHEGEGEAMWHLHKGGRRAISHLCEGGG